jgi:ABC-2 type transport system permease protein
VLLTIIYFVGHAFQSDPSRFGGQATDFFSFVLAGLCFMGVFDSAFRSFQAGVRDAQVNGTLEALLLTPVGIWRLLLGTCLLPLAVTSVRCIVAIALGVGVFGYWHHADPLAALAVLVPTVTTCALAGALAAALTLTIKQGDPVGPIFLGLNAVLGGVVFPITLLPAWVQPLSQLLPYSHGLSGIRLALQGQGFGAVGGDSLLLWASSLVLLPVAVVALDMAIRRAKKEGSLVHY